MKTRSTMKTIAYCIFFMIAGTLGVMAQKPVPYLQTPTSTSIWVNWRTESNPDSKVYYGLSEDKLANEASGTTQDLKDPGDSYSKNYYYHSVKLTGLQPATSYCYKVVSGSIESDVYRFRTQPENGDRGIYRFLILGDHQLTDDRYERLMTAAKSICESKYGTPIENHINLITNVGDQVDKGTLTQYEQVHFRRSETLSPHLPVMTIVGNHETYGTLGLDAYSAHFIYDEITYKDISSGSEFYYAFQVGRALFLMLGSEAVHTNNTQLAWASRVIEAAKADPNIDWIFSYNHRPIQAEQYIGDVSPWVRDKVMPLLNTTEKSVMNVSGHHHLYHRGQLRDYPAYHIITGGAAWDQRWGQSTEQDFDDVQKTIDYWPFQIVELNPETRSMHVETWVIGNQVETLAAPTLVDTFSRTFGQVKPDKPALLPLGTENPIELPCTFESSPYATTSGIDNNSVQFQVAASVDFAKLEFDLIRDFENIYGAHPANCQLVDLNKDVNIFRQTIERHQLFNGKHYIRVRHRDKNAEWSEWSDPLMFETTGGLAGEPEITSSKKTYDLNETISLSFLNASNLSGQWTGIYKEGQTPGSSTPSVKWKNSAGEAGLVTFELATPGVYYAAIFRDSGYDIITKTDLFYVGSIPVLSANKAKYETGESIDVSFTNAPALANDWIGIYKMGDATDPGAGGVTSTAWAYITAAQNNTLSIQSTNLEKGYYFITYLMQDGYFEPGERVYIQIGDEISSLSLLKSAVEPDEKIIFLFENGPGTPKDYVGIYKEGDVYGVDELTHYLYVYGEISGMVEWENHQLPAGNYYACLFTNDSYDAVSNKVEFSVVGGIRISSAADLQKIGKDADYPLDGSYYLTTDIDLSGVNNWIPIGANSVTDVAPKAFTGVLDGRGFTIGNLKITGTTIFKGLFGTLTHATVKNLTLEVNITSTAAQVGAVTASMEGETLIERVTVRGSITGSENVGGITGRVQTSVAYPLDNVIRNCHVNVTLKSTGAQAGGIAGRSNGSLLVEKVFVAGKIEAATTAVGQNAAGIVSYITWNLVKLVSSVVAVDEIKGSTPNLFYSRENRLEYFEDLYARNDINLQYHTVTNRGTGLEIVTGKMLLAPDHFKSQSFYVDTLRWDFNNVWTFGNDGYPELRKTTGAEVINNKGKKKVACIGNSITENVSLAYYDKYPSRLQELLGWDEYAVRNYGASGTCMLKDGANPYWNIGRFTAALNWKPDILVIKLGTNDTSDANWPKVANFKADYEAFIDTFKVMNPDVEIYVCHPIPTPGNADKDTKVKELGAIIKTISEEQEVTYVDLYAPLEGKGSYYIADEALHPNTNGAKIMANTLYRAIAGIDDEQQVVYVSPTGTGDGKSWENAADFNWAAHNVGNSQMWLKEGTYSLTAPVNFEGLFIYGGFSGNETALSERNWHTYPTILDGNNQVSVLRNRTTVTGDSIPCLLDGVIVQNGSSPSTENGGGILANNGAVLRNCIFRNNQTTNARNGAAIHCHTGTTLIENCLFVNNTSSGNGGAVQIGGNANAIMINCTMANNKSTGLGGAIGTGANNSNCTLINTIAYNNYNGSAFNSYALNGNINGGGAIASIHSAIESASTKFSDGDDVEHVVLTREITPDFVAPATIIGYTAVAAEIEQIAAASYQLAEGSLCIDAGNDDYAGEILLDLAGKRRVQGLQIDMGAYEFAVTNPVTGVSLDETSAELEIEGTLQLTATVAPDDATNQDVSWRSDDDEVATVSETGWVTAIAEGTANIIVITDDGEFKDTCRVTVIPRVIPVTGVSLDETSAELEIEGTLQLTATVAPDEATNQDVSWRSDDNEVATVSETGWVTAIAEGTANIIVETVDGAFKDTCRVTVKINAGIEASAAYQPAKVAYANGILRLVNLEGYTAALFSVEGQMVARFQINTPDDTYSQALPGGMYFLTVKKNGDRKVFKLIGK